MVLLATKICMFTMLSTMALGRELTSVNPTPHVQEVGDSLYKVLAHLQERIEELESRQFLTGDYYYENDEDVTFQRD